MCWLGEIFSKKQRNGIIQLISQLHLHSTPSVIQLLHYRYPPFKRAPPPTPPPSPSQLIPYSQSHYPSPSAPPPTTRRIRPPHTTQQTQTQTRHRRHRQRPHIRRTRHPGRDPRVVQQPRGNRSQHTRRDGIQNPREQAPNETAATTALGRGGVLGLGSGGGGGC